VSNTDGASSFEGRVEQLARNNKTVSSAGALNTSIRKIREDFVNRRVVKDFFIWLSIVLGAAHPVGPQLIFKKILRDVSRRLDVGKLRVRLTRLPVAAYRATRDLDRGAQQRMKVQTLRALCAVFYNTDIRKICSRAFSPEPFHKLLELRVCLGFWRFEPEREAQKMGPGFLKHLHCASAFPDPPLVADTSAAFPALRGGCEAANLGIIAI